MVKISAVIPVMRWDLVIDLLRDIQANTVYPEKVMLINNSKIPPSFFPGSFNYNIEVLDFGRNIGVNAAWNHAIKDSTFSHLSVLNDDIRINKYFFEMNLDDLNDNLDTRVGILCPETVDDIETFEIYVADIIEYDLMRKREGWSFTIRNTLRKQLPLIPSELFVFCGDDWIWTWTHELNYVWMKNYSNVIYHKVGGSLRESENRPLRALLRKEKQVYSKLIKEAMNEKRSKGCFPVCK